MDLLEFMSQLFVGLFDFNRAGCIAASILMVTVAVAWGMFISALPDWTAYMVGGLGLILAVYTYIRGTAVGA